MILTNKALLVVAAAIALVAAQAECNNDNDCPGSEVCCSANVCLSRYDFKTVLMILNSQFGEGGEATLCIPQSSCVNVSTGNSKYGAVLTQ